MKIEVQQVGELMTNCYIVWDENTGNAAVIDPGDDGAYLADCLKKNNLTLQYILLTHGHYDHTGGVAELRQTCGTEPVIYMSVKDLGLDHRLERGRHRGHGQRHLSGAGDPRPYPRVCVPCLR